MSEKIETIVGIALIATAIVAVVVGAWRCSPADRAAVRSVAGAVSAVTVAVDCRREAGGCDGAR